MVFSIILATYGRYSEVADFFGSLLLQEYPIKDIEIILVDQNDNINLSSIVDTFSNKGLCVTHVKSKIKGLSFSRNIGLDVARGQYVSFPDDDCVYYKDTLSKAFKQLESENLDVVLGSIRDRKSGCDLLKKWPATPVVLNRFNLYKLSSSITIFAKKSCGLFFDEKLGSGSFFGSCEDVDYLYRLLVSGHDCKYFPSVEVWHPDNSLDDFSVEKSVSYGLGFGAFCKKHKKDYVVGCLFLLGLSYCAFRMFISLVKLDAKHVSIIYASFKSRLNGFVKY